jgi:hypothetical protein
MASDRKQVGGVAHGTATAAARYVARDSSAERSRRTRGKAKHVSKKRGRGRDGDQTDQIERIDEGRRRQAERVQALLATRQSAQAFSRLSRRGISSATTIRLALTSAPADWAPANRGRPIIDAIHDSIEDGSDRAIMAWPARPGPGPAVAMREARASGRLAYATIAFWPWRNGATWAARSILVHPGDIAQAAARAADEMHRGAARAQPDLAHDSAPFGNAPARPNAIPGIQGKNKEFRAKTATDGSSK